MKKLWRFLILAALILLLSALRPALVMPTVETRAQTAATEEDASLLRLLSPEGDGDLAGISVYVYGLPADRLAASLGKTCPTRVTFWFDGRHFAGLTTTYDGAGEFFDWKGRSAAQLDGMSYTQFLAEWKQ